MGLLMQCVSLRETPQCCHLIPRQKCQPTATEKCKQASGEQVHFPHASAYGNTNHVADVYGYFLVNVCISQSQERTETLIRVSVCVIVSDRMYACDTAAFDFVLFHLTFPWKQ